MLYVYHFTKWEIIYRQHIESQLYIPEWVQLPFPLSYLTIVSNKEQISLILHVFLYDIIFQMGTTSSSVPFGFQVFGSFAHPYITYNIYNQSCLLLNGYNCPFFPLLPGSCIRSGADNLILYVAYMYIIPLTKLELFQNNTRSRFLKQFGVSNCDFVSTVQNICDVP